MKNSKIGIITLIGKKNFGNRLQNYALQEGIKKIGYDCETIKNFYYTNNKNNYYFKLIKFKLLDLYYYLKHSVKLVILFVFKHRRYKKENRKIDRKRIFYFENFDKNIKFANKKITAKNCDKFKYDHFIVGSDQVWNPNYNSLTDIELLNFAKPRQRISYAASFGISELPEEYKEKTKKELLNFKKISVRENEGKKIVEELTNRDDVEVVVDPTMLLTTDEWDKVAKRPENLKEGKYILNYFLGKLSSSRKQEIERVAKEKGYYIINILDKNDPYYCCGPSEFIYLEKNASLICTDSFHSTVFAILYNRPFIVFNREQKQKNNNMNSRLTTLLKKFNLENRFFENGITDDLLEEDYQYTYKVLEEERKKAYKFLSEALED